MRPSLTTLLSATAGVGLGAISVYLLDSTLRTREPSPPVTAQEVVAQAEPVPANVSTFHDPNSNDPRDLVFTSPDLLDGTIFSTAQQYTGKLRDGSSLAGWRDAIAGRSRRGIDALRKLQDAAPESAPTDDPAQRADRARSIGLLYLYDGQLGKADEWMVRAREIAERSGLPADLRGNLTALRGIIALRRGEVDNCVACVGPSSCIFPISAEAVHSQQTGSRDAVRHFRDYLAMYPGDLRVRWLLTIALMTLAEEPSEDLERFVVRLPATSNDGMTPRFTNVATAAGLTVRGPGQAGGAIFDDFNGDGFEDIFVSSFDSNDGPSLYLNRGDGGFDDHSIEAGVSDQVYALNVRRADYDNDGDLDLLLLRGGWENPARMSLLRNRGDATFEDVTREAGLIEPIASEAAEWGDFDGDGLLDLYVCGEYLPPFGGSSGALPDPRNVGRLYRNQGDGTFRDVAEIAGVTNEQCGKGAAWGDYDDDGDLDLFVVNMGGPNRLYRNRGDSTFEDVAGAAGVREMPAAFTCFFWDFDNDGHLDLFVSDYQASHAQAVAGLMDLPVNPALHPRIYHNRGDATFEDVAPGLGLGQPIPAMAANCADIDNDGDLDLYLGTGFMAYSGLFPDMMWRNDGSTFVDVTAAAGTGHLQKGHGVSFADYDHDGDLDAFSALGGGYPGDKGYYGLFRNAGNGKHWLSVRLVGTKSNRSAIGARLHAEVLEAGGSTRSIHRQVGTNGSFGGNSLAEFLGLGNADSVARLTIRWPAGGEPQVFEAIPADRVIVVTEGEAEYQSNDSNR